MHCFVPWFYFNAGATPDIYTLSLHDALPISARRSACGRRLTAARSRPKPLLLFAAPLPRGPREKQKRSEEHTSELQSLTNLVCRLLLEKKKLISQKEAMTSNTRDAR